MFPVPVWRKFFSISFGRSHSVIAPAVDVIVTSLSFATGCITYLNCKFAADRLSLGLIVDAPVKLSYSTLAMPQLCFSTLAFNSKPALWKVFLMNAVSEKYFWAFKMGRRTQSGFSVTASSCHSFPIE